MDRGIVALMIPMTALLIGLVAVLFKGYHRGIELRIREMEARKRVDAGVDSEAVEELRQELAEVQERLDFAERMLANRRDEPQLRKPEQR